MKNENKDSNKYLVLSQEQIKGKGEDFFLFEHDEDRLIMGVFDGCGGSGAKVYPGVRRTYRSQSSVQSTGSSHKDLVSGLYAGRQPGKNS